MKSLVQYINEKKGNLDKSSVKTLFHIWSVFMNKEDDPRWEPILTKAKKDQNVSEKERWAEEVYQVLKDNTRTTRDLTMNDFDGADYGMFKSFLKYVAKKYHKEIEDWDFDFAIKQL